MGEHINGSKVKIAYVAWPPDNDTYMWAHTKKTGVPPPGILCDVCSQRVDYDAVNPRYKPPRRYYDLSSCYDGDYLVSPRLREHLERSGLVGISFKEIPSSSSYFILRCSNVLRIKKTSSLHLDEFCNACAQYRSVWGSEPEESGFERVSEPIRVGIYLSDLRVGYYPQMGPLLIVGLDTWEALLSMGFKGLKNGKPIIHS
jgi:hypothetical protein